MHTLNTKLFKNVLIYGFGRSSEQLLKFMLLPLYTRFLTTSDYGILSLVNLATGFAGVLFSLGTQSSVFRYYRIDDNKMSRDTVFYSSFMLLIVWISLLMITLYFFREKISFILFNDDQYGNHIMIGLGITAMGSLYNLPMYILRAEDKAIIFVKNNLIKIIINIILGVFFVTILKRSALGALEAGLLSTIIFALYTLTYRIKKSKFNFNLDKLFLLLKYGAPLIFSGVGLIIINSSDKYFLKMSNSLDIVGIYAVGYTIGSSINIFIASFQAAWPQMMFSVSDKPNSDIIYGKVLTYYVYFIGMIWIILSSFSYEIIFFMTDHKFLDSYSVIPIVSLAYAFQGAASISSAGIYVKNKTFNELLLMPISIGICLLANYYLIPYYSFIGAAYATLISFAMIFILYSIKGQKYVKLIIEWKKLFKIILLLSLFYNAQYSINFQNIWYSIIFKIVLISLLFFITLTSKSLFYNDITYSLINRIKK